jgi:hypothetical protein
MKLLRWHPDKALNQCTKADQDTNSFVVAQALACDSQ